MATMTALEDFDFEVARREKTESLGWKAEHAREVCPRALKRRRGDLVPRLFRSALRQ